MGDDLGLRDEERAALETIVRGRRAWIAGLAESIVRRLMEVGLVALWVNDAHGRELNGGPYATLTPWGAEQLGVELRERHWIKWVHSPDHHDRILVEEPYWARVNSRPLGPFVLPHQARQCGLDYPELVPDPSPGPEYLTDEEGKPIILLGGYKATIDHRLRLKGSQ